MSRMVCFLPPLFFGLRAVTFTSTTDLYFPAKGWADKKSFRHMHLDGFITWASCSDARISFEKPNTELPGTSQGTHAFVEGAEVSAGFR